MMLDKLNLVLGTNFAAETILEPLSHTLQDRAHDYRITEETKQGIRSRKVSAVYLFILLISFFLNLIRQFVGPTTAAKHRSVENDIAR